MDPNKNTDVLSLDSAEASGPTSEFNCNVDRIQTREPSCPVKIPNTRSLETGLPGRLDEPGGAGKVVGSPAPTTGRVVQVGSLSATQPVAMYEGEPCRRTV